MITIIIIKLNIHMKEQKRKGGQKGFTYQPKKKKEINPTKQNPNKEWVSNVSKQRRLTYILHITREKYEKSSRSKEESNENPVERYLLLLLSLPIWKIWKRKNKRLTEQSRNLCSSRVQWNRRKKKKVFFLFLLVRKKTFLLFFRRNEMIWRRVRKKETCWIWSVVTLLLG